MEESIVLVNEKGDISVYIDASITDTGDLRLSGQDLGKELEGIFGDSEYEYFLTIPSAFKDKVLLALIEKIYKGNARVISDVRSLLETKGIPCEFFAT